MQESAPKRRTTIAGGGGYVPGNFGISKDQPTDIAQKVRDILRSPPEMKPAKSQSSLLVRCLGRKDAARPAPR